LGLHRKEKSEEGEDVFTGRKRGEATNWQLSKFRGCEDGAILSVGGGVSGIGRAPIPTGSRELKALKKRGI